MVQFLNLAFYQGLTHFFTTLFSYDHSQSLNVIWFNLFFDKYSVLKFNMTGSRGLRSRANLHVYVHRSQWHYSADEVS